LISPPPLPRSLGLSPSPSPPPLARRWPQADLGTVLDAAGPGVGWARHGPDWAPGVGAYMKRRRRSADAASAKCLVHMRDPASPLEPPSGFEDRAVELIFSQLECHPCTVPSKWSTTYQRKST
jgi:hypothetical protein